MKKFDFDYSMKNIPIPSNRSYKLKLVDKMELVVKRMRWKAHFYFEDQKRKNKGELTKNQERKENFGFKSKSCPKPLKELDNFEKELFDITKNLKFRNTHDNFQQQLKKDIQKINKSSNVLVFADKTSNIYELKPDDHKRLLMNNITKTYKKVADNIEDSINSRSERNS